MYLCFLDPSKAVSSVLSFSSLTFSHPSKENESRRRKNLYTFIHKIQILVYSGDPDHLCMEIWFIRSKCRPATRPLETYRIIFIVFLSSKGFLKWYAEKKFSCSKEKVWRWCNTSRKTEDVLTEDGGEAEKHGQDESRLRDTMTDGMRGRRRDGGASCNRCSHRFCCAAAGPSLCSSQTPPRPLALRLRVCVNVRRVCSSLSFVRFYFPTLLRAVWVLCKPTARAL